MIHCPYCDGAMLLSEGKRVEETAKGYTVVREGQLYWYECQSCASRSAPQLSTHEATMAVKTRIE